MGKIEPKFSAERIPYTYGGGLQLCANISAVLCFMEIADSTDRILFLEGW